MRRTAWLQDTRMERFEEAFGAWTESRLTQEEAARLLGICERTFRRWIDRFEEAGLDGLIDKHLSQASNRRAPVDRYRNRHRSWNVRHFHAWWYQRDGGKRSYTWVKSALQTAGLVARASRRGAHRKQREAANRYLRETYLPAFNAEFARPPREEGSAFVACGDAERLDEILCEHHERVVGHDNCIRFRRKVLQIPPDRYCCHYVKATVKVLQYPDGCVAIRHGPCELARYDPQGELLTGNLRTAA